MVGTAQQRLLKTGLLGVCQDLGLAAGSASWKKPPSRDHVKPDHASRVTKSRWWSRLLQQIIVRQIRLRLTQRGIATKSSS
jgi:hypothetical protein